MNGASNSNSSSRERADSTREVEDFLSSNENELSSTFVKLLQKSNFSQKVQNVSPKQRLRESRYIQAQIETFNDNQNQGENEETDIKSRLNLSNSFKDLYDNFYKVSRAQKRQQMREKLEEGQLSFPFMSTSKQIS